VPDISLVIDGENQTVPAGTTGTTWFEKSREVVAIKVDGIPRDLFTPLFVLSRTVGWIAHNIEHKLYDNRIVRPAAKYVGTMEDYVPREER